MGGVLVDDDHAVPGLGDDIGLMHLGAGRAEWEIHRIEDRRRCGVFGDARGPVRLSAGGDFRKAGNRLDSGGECAAKPLRGCGLPAALAPGGIAGGGGRRRVSAGSKAAQGRA